MKKRWIITAILAITLCAICFSFLPTHTQAAALIKTGTCGKEGDNLTWTLDDTGLLTISGTGEMPSYYEGDARWFPYWEQIITVVIEEGVTSIGSASFSGCSNLTSVTIPQTVTYIEDMAFMGCESLTSVVIPDSVTSLGREAFCDCSSLASVTLPNGITIVEEYTFYNCESLVSVIIPDSVTHIDESAFEGCSALLSVTLPKETKRIGLRAFYNCKRLWHVFYKGTELDWANIEIMSDQNELHWAGRHYNCNGTETVNPATKTCNICVTRCNHNWNTGTVTKQPTAEEEGELTYTCIACDSIKTEPIEKAADATPDNEQSANPDATTDAEQVCANDTSGTIPWWWLLVVGGICLVSNLVFVIIILKKKK